MPASGDDEVKVAPAPLAPMGAQALRLLQLARTNKDRPLVHLSPSGRSAQALLAVLEALAPDLQVALYPAWDTLPYDRTPPSAAVMGMRMGVLRWLLHTPPDLVLTTAPALLRRVPPRSVWPKAHLEFRTGDPIDPAAAEADLRRLGYVVDDRVDEPGEAAPRGQVIDLFPAAAPLPCRIEYVDGRITAIRSYHPVSQRSEVETDLLVVDPASELVQAGNPEEPSGYPHDLGPALVNHYGQLETVFDYAPGARIVADGAGLDRADDFLEQVADLNAGAAEFRLPGDATSAFPAPDRLFLDAATWHAELEQRRVGQADEGPGSMPVPRFIEGSNPGGALRDFLKDRLGRQRVVLTAGTERALRLLSQRVERNLEMKPRRVTDWQAALATPRGEIASLLVPFDRGFVDDAENLTVVTASDVLGSRGSAAVQAERVELPLAETEFRIGDAVVHLDHGMSVLEGLEEVDLGDGEASDVLRLRYAGDKVQLTPVGDIDRLWRYSGDGSAVTLDRLDGSAWAERRARVEADIEASAARLVEIAQARRQAVAPKLVPPTRDYERFCARFAYALTPDQSAAVDATLADLASGRPMVRLVCGDVGFGKTEVALRAAAAAVLAGKQVAVVAPTTVLVQQHVRAFRRRFAPFGIEVGHLSRLAKPSDARKVKAALADGSLRLVVGTHALAAKGVRFADLGLVVIDEEHHFGAAQKEKLRNLGAAGHVLTLTATPIPRTLQTSLVGLQDLSIIATPPVLRQPIRTVMAPFDEMTVRDALLREQRRGGQSFFVCPRIEDIEPMAARLRMIVPSLRMLIVHGKMPADEVDGVMVGFAEGEGDLLLATNIIESGLDVPRANTMMIWRPDRFGLAQLHQLRGRVGRSSRRATAFLLTDPEHPLAPATERRLKSLVALDRLGAGFALSARDLDLRGAGALVGDEQAGHVTAIGLGLYQHLLDRALRAARGEDLDDDWAPELHLGVSGRIPPDYIPEPEVRINIYAQADSVEDENDVTALEAEVADRFGPIPEAMASLLELVRIKALCRKLRIGRLDAGPQAIAATLHRQGDGREQPPDLPGWEWKGERLICRRAVDDPHERLHLVAQLLQQAVVARSVGAGKKAAK
jgi:transcription-repair coupling factor (superfamily II helicase)